VRFCDVHGSVTFFVGVNPRCIVLLLVVRFCSIELNLIGVLLVVWVVEELFIVLVVILFYKLNRFGFEYDLVRLVVDCVLELNV
jgi:hypothetical protein